MIQLIRHFESKGNADHSAYEVTPDWAMPLSDRGREQAKEIGAKLHQNTAPIHKNIFVSPFVRTRQTLELTMEENPWLQSYTVIEDGRLREQNWGNGSRRDVQERTGYGTYFYKFPNGESVAEVDDRIKSFLLSYELTFGFDNYSSTNTLIFAHGMTNRVLLMNLLKKTPKDLECWRTQKNGGVWNIVNGNLTLLGDPIEYYPDCGHKHWDFS